MMEGVNGNSSQNQRNEAWSPTNAEIANQVINKYTAGTTSSTNKRKQIQISKQNDEEYSKKRARNNIAVKKSREKAKSRIYETQTRVEQLSVENEQLQEKVKHLTRELTSLRTLFTNGGFSLPDISPVSAIYNRPEIQVNTSSFPQNNSGPTSASSTSPHHSSVIHHGMESKSNFDRIQPLKPLPRIIPYHHSPSKISQSESYLSSSSDRDSFYSNCESKYPVNSELIKRKNDKNSISSKLTTPSDDASDLSASTLHQNSNMKHENTQHTSVIRTTTSGIYAHKNSLSQNSLGKFCIIKDPDDGGQIKIVPLES